MKPLIIVGDVHAEWALFNDNILSQIPPTSSVIQVGDLGCYPSQLPVFARPFDFVEGNHDYIPGLVDGVMPCPIPFIETDEWGVSAVDGRVRRYSRAVDTSPVRMLDVDTKWRGARYRARGTIDVIDGRRVAFLGGAESIIDRASRRQYINWWPEEAVRLEDTLPLLDYKGPSVDLLITHMPPDQMVKAIWGYASTYTQKAVQAVWEYLGKPRLICGHMHPSKPVHWHNVTCLPILGVIDV